MNNRDNTILWFFYDITCVIGLSYFTYFFIYPFQKVFPDIYIPAHIALFLSLYVLMNIKCKLYARVWRFASIKDMVDLAAVIFAANLLVMFIQSVAWKTIRYRYYFLFFTTVFFALIGLRMLQRLFCDHIQKLKGTKTKRTLIIGAGRGGQMLVRDLNKYEDTNLKPVCYLDDEPVKRHKIYLGLPVAGGIEDLESVLLDYKIEQIIIAMPSVGKKILSKTADICIKTGINTMIMPKIEDVLTGEIKVEAIRRINIEDLLGREPVKLNNEQIARQIKGLTVLVTGAGGSIGSEICRQLIKFKPQNLILLGHGENSIYQIHNELSGLILSEVQLIPIIADVKDIGTLHKIFETYKPNIVYHAAAHKHVPLMEQNPKEAILNNVFGTKNIAEAAHMHNVSNFVMISTDKAVKPPNIMGASKRIAEEVIRSYNKKSNTRFVAVRFGNVLGSRGSVVPLFQDQIKKGGPITITDRRMTRYFMTIPEASRLVMQAGALEDDGEIYILDMGEPVKIIDLARDMIRLSGYLEEEIKIVEVGIRPGEKLYEELLTDNEEVSHKVYNKIFVGKSEKIDENNIQNFLDHVLTLSDKEAKQITLGLANKKA